MPACCEVDGAAPKARCPSCGQPGLPVSRATVAALTRLTVDAPRLAAKHYHFCEAATCQVVYFARDNVRIERAEVRVPVHRKDGDLDVPLCYCFGYTRARLVEEGEAAFSVVAAAVRMQRCACDVKNPSGRCCLGDLRRFLRALPRTAPKEDPG